MENFDCPVCLDNIYYDSQRKMLYSQHCNHRLCDRCLDAHLGQLGRGQCPQCRYSLTKADFKEREPEETLFASEREIRKRITSIYNDTRDNFQATPEYNDFLEKREEMIYGLSFGTDEQRKRNLESEIKMYEKHNSQKISTNVDLRIQREKQKIKDIVQKEGTFYEAVKHNLHLRPNENYSHLIHPLQKQYASFFKGETNYETLISSDGFAKPLNSFIKTENDIPINYTKTREDRAKAELAGGYQRVLISERNRTEFQICLLFQPS